MKSDYIKFVSKAVLLAAQLNVASMAINAQAASQFALPIPSEGLSTGDQAVSARDKTSDRKT